VIVVWPGLGEVERAWTGLGGAVTASSVWLVVGVVAMNIFNNYLFY